MAEPLTVSFSKLQTWDRCHFQYHLSYEQGWTPAEKKSYLEIGSAIHGCLERWYGHHTWEAVQDYLRGLAQEGGDAETLFVAMNVMKRYVFDYAPEADKDIEVVGVEQEVRVPMVTPSGHQFILNGYIDMIYKEKGRIWEMSDKTVGGGRFWSETECMMDPQPGIYQIALRKLGIPVFGVKYNFLNTHVYKDPAVSTDKLFRRVTSYRTDIELNNIEAEFLKQVDDLIKNKLDTTRSLRRDCNLCQFQEPCLLNLKGIELQSLMKANYKQKGDSPHKTSPLIPKNKGLSITIG